MDPSTWRQGCLLSLLLFVLLFFLLWQLYKKKTHRPLPFSDIPYAVPNPHWLLGHLPHLGAGIVQGQKHLCVTHASTNDTLGVSTFYVLNQACFSCLDASLMRRLLQFTQQRKGAAHQRKHFARLFGKNSILMQNGPQWKASRQLLHKVLVASANQRDLQDKMCASARKLEVALLSSLSTLSSPQTKMAVDGLRLSRLWSLQVFGDSVLGHDFGCRDCFSSTTTTPPSVFEQTAFLQTEFTRRCFHERFSLSAQWYGCPWDARNAQHRAMHQGLRDTLKEILQTRRQLNQQKTQTTSASSNLVDRLLQAVQEAEGRSLLFGSNSKDHDDDALADWLVTLLFGGYDTTALCLTFTLYLLAKHPEYQEHCAEEARRVLGTPAMSGSSHASSSASFDVSRDLPMIQACLLESLRLYPPATITARNLDRTFSFEMPSVEPSQDKKEEPATMDKNKKTTTRTATLPVDTRIVCSFYWIHRDERNFARPNDFCPERWVQPREKSQSQERPIDNAKQHKDDSDSNKSHWEARTLENDHLNSSSGSEATTSPTTTIPVGNRQNLLAFSAGARNCVGQTLAYRMLPLLLGHLSRGGVRWALDGDNNDGKPYEMVLERYGGNACPKYGLPLTLTNVKKKRKMEPQRD